MEYEFDYLVFIGRFTPFHPGHLRVVRKALEKAEKLIVVLGSSNRPETILNPFTANERIRIIESFLTDEELCRIEFVQADDFLYNDTKWITHIHTTIQRNTWNTYNDNPKIGLIGHEKDHSSFYLKLFPMWGNVSVPNFNDINATDIREYFYKNGTLRGCPAYQGHNGQADFIEQLFKKKPWLTEEYQFINQYKSQWNNSPHPPTFVTTDALVEQAGHILVVERGAKPGKGLLALPGGFVEQNLSLLDNTIKELREETRIKVPEKILRGSIVAKDTFDHPKRSLRGRTITTCFHFKLEGVALEKVRGGDDAAKAYWMPLNEVIRKESQFFEDHFDIIQSMLGI